MEREKKSEMLKAGSKTYFFDIKESELGDLYLIITESKKTESGFDHYRLMIFEENMKDFVDFLVLQTRIDQLLPRMVDDFSGRVDDENVP